MKRSLREYLVVALNPDGREEIIEEGSLVPLRKFVGLLVADDLLDVKARVESYHIATMEVEVNESYLPKSSGSICGDNQSCIVYLDIRLQLKNLKHSSSEEDSTKELYGIS